MKIDIQLFSVDSIRRAIIALNNAKDNLRWGVQDTVECLAEDGAGIAQAAYGSMANAVSYSPEEGTAIIATSGEDNLIAEFGAGQATMPVMFENNPDTPVYEGSYSELVGTQEYYKTGSWHFGGRYFTEVPARHGLLDAKQYIIEHSTEIAQEVIEL